MERLIKEPPPNILDSEDSPYSITPLPPVLQHGLAAVATFGFLSFFASTGLFTFLCYKIVVWASKPPPKKQEDERPESMSVTDFDGFLVPDDHFCPQKAPEIPPIEESFWERMRKNPPNQFLVLIINLLLADIQQALAFLLNVVWLTRNKLEVGSMACWAQGWFVSTGDLASSVFLSAIAVHTYLGIVQGYRLPSWAFYSAIGMMWAFVYGLSILPIIVTDNGAADGGLYVRAGAWCWINSAYQDLRLHVHYLWIFLSIALTTIIYTIIFLHIRSMGRKAGRVPQDKVNSLSRSDSTRSNSSAQHYPNPDPNKLKRPDSPDTFDSSVSSLYKELPPIPNYARQQTFLLYPLIYICCTVPIAAGRIASMAGNNVSLAYFCFAGSMIACNGWLDVLLYSTTRRSIVFSGEAPGQDTGLDTFAFMRTPPTRKFGNVVIVSGGQDPEGKGRRWNKWSEKVIRGGGKLGKLKTEKNASSDSLRGFGMGQGAVMGMAIQCETTTVVSIEEADDHNSVRSVSRNGSVRSGTTLGGRKGSLASLQPARTRQ